ncbi:hypothetical protein GOP47_0017877 [Adiantum capillus-veneris]|uniref:Sodium/calcium exchanger membrane region domain-containing protein n=1 Tax=Adiantum capillus-veneris TaxID=13818 RepID=A0A9D4UH64_ADICA|nr:hypothetical protein GOP47_0017877 [Adiantum capillus-veneris]
MPRFLLVLLLLVCEAEPALCFPGSKSASPSSAGRFRHSLFSTYSPNPWFRKSRLWQQDAHHGGAVTHRNSNFLPFHGDPDNDCTAQVQCTPTENSTLSESLKPLPHGCQGSVKNTYAQVAALTLWILVLFYLLGTTASDYFSCILEKLSEVLKLSPAVAGVTLLAIGNGAPDVFSSVAAFVSSDQTGSIGFSSVLGGALFITTVVSGTVALVTARVCKREGYRKISLVCFVRDVLFLLASTGVLAAILLDGKVRLWEAIAFLCVYLVYAASVWAAEMLENRHRGASSVLDPLLSKGSGVCLLPHLSNPQHHSHLYHVHTQDLEVELEYYLENSSSNVAIAKCKSYALFVYKYGIEWPLAVPRLLTIPVVEEERWCRPLAVISCCLAPLLLAGLYLLESNSSAVSLGVILGVSGGIGIFLGLLALLSTENTKPPRRFLWLWLAGGFIMSIVWFYIVADQLVGSLETLGSIFEIDPAILGLTVLAWGNSIGDLVADLALACSGRDGVQIAISGCYAGPLFNTVVGLGLSLVVACSRAYPEPLFVADDDGSLFFIIGFLGAGLAWALVMMPLKGMRLSRSLGAGLVVVYCSFLATGMCYAMGWILR